LFYTLTREDIWPPYPSDLKRKEDWVKAVQQEIAKPGETRLIKVKYEMHNPEIDRIMKFFNGPVIEYFVIQSTDMVEGRPEPAVLDQYREMLLLDALGYDTNLPDGRVIRQRKSTATFQSVQRWCNFLEEIKEIYFEPNGYEMPDSDEYHILEDGFGKDRATEICIERIQKKLMAKLSPQS